MRNLVLAAALALAPPAYADGESAVVCPLRTPITKISRSGLHLMRDHWRNRRSAGVREGMALGTDHPVEELAARYGWSHLGP